MFPHQYHRSMVCVVLGVMLLLLLIADVQAQPLSSDVCDYRERQIWTTFWGAAATLVALVLDGWSSTSTEKHKFKRFRKFFKISLSPIGSLHQVLYHASLSRSLISRFNKNMWKDADAIGRIKIVVSGDVVVHLSNHNPSTIEASLSSHIEATSSATLYLEEALVIGKKPEENDRSPPGVLLNLEGKIALLRASLEPVDGGGGRDVLPGYNQLRILQGSTGLAAFFSTVQGVGYIFSVVLRLVQHLPTTPMELISMVLSLIIITKGVLHVWAGACHHPLVLYLDSEQQHRFLQACATSTTLAPDESGKIRSFRWQIAAGLIMTVSLNILVWFLSSLQNYLSKMTIRALQIFILGLSLEFYGLFIDKDSTYSPSMAKFFHALRDGDGMVQCLRPALYLLSGLLLLLSHAYSVFVTVAYWDNDFFYESRSPWSSILPHLGG